MPFRPKSLREVAERASSLEAWGGALAEYLAASCAFPAPVWTRGAGRFLPDPWWPLPRIAEHPHLREWIAARTPAVFREHNIYIDENSLVRV